MCRCGLNPLKNVQVRDSISQCHGQFACAILSTAACPALLYFSPSYHELHDFLKEVMTHTCFGFLYTFASNISHSKKNSEILSKLYIGLTVKHQLFFSDCNETWTFWTDFRNMLKSNFMKILSVGSGRTDGQTDGRSNMTKVIVASRSFARASENAATL
jgi:hypothetical protein